MTETLGASLRRPRGAIGPPPVVYPDRPIPVGPRSAVAGTTREVEPEIFLTIFSQAERGLGETAVQTTASLITILMRRADIRKTDPRIVAELLLRLLVSFVLVPKLTDDDDEEAVIRRLFRECVLRGIAKS